MWRVVAYFILGGLSSTDDSQNTKSGNENERESGGRQKIEEADDEWRLVSNSLRFRIFTLDDYFLLLLLLFCRRSRQRSRPATCRIPHSFDSSREKTCEG